MRILSHLFEKNRQWAAETEASDPEFFVNLAKEQNPDYLWIGCADSRVPANVIIGTPPGEVFVHRNVANLVVQTDLNCLSVIQYAVEALQVKHIIVCGHYGCGGVKAALEDAHLGLIDNWLRHVQDVAHKHQPLLTQLPDAQARHDKLCELNVLEQVRNVCRTTIVREAWERGQELSVHGWIYALHDGLLKDLGICVTNSIELDQLKTP